jgi:tetratricopeptide (TPR) repeat protein
VTARLIAAGEDVPEALRVLLREDALAAVRLAGQLSAFWQDAGDAATGRELTAAAIAAGAVGAADAASMARAVLVAADLAFRQGDQSEASRLADEAIDLATKANDPRTAALAWLDHARVAFRDSDAPGIEAASHQAQGVAPGDPVVHRGVLHMLAWAAYTAGDIDEARRRFEESLALRRQQGSRIGVASELSNLGDLAMEAGDRIAASQYLREAYAIGLELGSQYILVNTLPSLAVLAAGDEPARAARLFGAADALARDSGLMPDPGADHTEDRSSLRTSMGAERFDGLVADGAALGLEASTALALPPDA